MFLIIESFKEMHSSDHVCVCAGLWESAEWPAADAAELWNPEGEDQSGIIGQVNNVLG